MTMVVRSEIHEALLNAGLDEDAVREDYSGRGMFGSTCFGIVTDDSGFALFCASVGSFMDDWDWVGDVQSDGMGLETIYYWRRVKLVDDEGES